MMRVLARAPSNIALVKYMGKSERPEDLGRNIPENGSLSMTLSSLCTFVEVRRIGSGRKAAVWIPEVPEGARGEAPRLDGKGAEKFVAHFERCRARMPFLARAFALDIAGMEAASFELRSANTFPHAAGIASSASSFAGLTLAAIASFCGDPEGFRRKFASEPALRRALAALSREGSGSSCRSFEGPFVVWRGERAEPVPSKLPPLSDLVVVVSSSEKKVGSSEAHRRVRSSPYWSGRVERAERRLRELERAFEGDDFATVSAIAEADFRDMHQLFETATPPFSYFAEGTNRVLEFLEGENSDSFVLTMDAGPNVHVIVPQSAEAHWKQKLSEAFPEFPILVDRGGSGAEIVSIEDLAKGGAT